MSENLSKKESHELDEKVDGFDIDFREIVIKLHEKRRFILKITLIFFALGIIVAVLTKREYSSTVTMVPQFGEGKNSKLGGLSGLAAMAGFNLGDGLSNSSDVLSPTIYPQILQSASFKKELMYSKISLEESSREVTIYEYFTDPKYEEFNLLASIKKYTIGLPFVILKSIKGEQKVEQNGKTLKFLKFTSNESKVAAILNEITSLTINEKEGTITLESHLTNAYLATQIVENTRNLLQEYITNIKIDRVKRNLAFLSERFKNAKQEYIAKQQELAGFQDANRNVILQSSKTYQDRLINELNISLSVYSELAKQLEQAKIKVKDETPVLTVISPAFIPTKSFKPNKPMIVFMLTFFGFALSSGIVLVSKKVKELIVYFKRVS